MSIHINPGTGVLAPCVETPCRYGQTYQTFCEAASALEIQHNIHHSAVPPHYTYSFDELLEKAVARGFYRATPGDDIEQAQLNLLLHREGLLHMAKSLLYIQNDNAKNRVARSLAWAAKQIAEKNNEEIFKVCKNRILPMLKGEAATSLFMSALLEQPPTTSDLLATSAELWLYRNSPLHRRAKYLLFSGNREVSGYTPKEEQLELVFSSVELASAIGIQQNHYLPENVIAFDIEGDTSRGYGLRPTLSQITEIVISTSEKTTVLAGDEKFILQRFAAIMNNLQNHNPEFVIAGWNNHLFDNIFLQTRAEYHNIDDWMGSISKAKNTTSFEPCGPTSCAQKLNWNGMKDVDLFQIKTMADRARGQWQTIGLKDFIEMHGFTPVRVERNNLHLLSEDERVRYAASDGICTLAAYTLIVD